MGQVQNPLFKNEYARLGTNGLLSSIWRRLPEAWWKYAIWPECDTDHGRDCMRIVLSHTCTRWSFWVIAYQPSSCSNAHSHCSASLVHHATNSWDSILMLLQRKHTIMNRKDLSVQLAGRALFIAVACNELMPAQGCFWKGGWACHIVMQRLLTQTCLPANCKRRNRIGSGDEMVGKRSWIKFRMM